MVRHILFVVGQLSVGGIETYILRMARSCAAKGMRITVWVVKPTADPELLTSLQQVADVVFLTPRAIAYPAWVLVPRLPRDVDLVFSTGRTSLLFAASAAARHGQPVRLVAGVFSQWEYCVDDGSAKHDLAMQILQQIGPANMVFCTEGCKQDHAAVLGAACKDSLVSSLLVELPAVRERPITWQDQTVRIVTASRLVDFKSSNFQLPAILRELRDAGIRATWTLIGAGPEKAKLENLIEKARVGEYVRLVGTIPYSQLHDAIAGADLYIGGGTTLIEASAIGVPAIVALDNNKEPTTPGFFADSTGAYTSDAAPNAVMRPIRDLITAWVASPDSFKVDLRARSIARARHFDVAQAPSEIEAILATARPQSIATPALFQARFMAGTVFEVFAYLISRFLGGRFGIPTSARAR